MNHTESHQVRILKERYKQSLGDKIEIIEQQIESIMASAGDSDSITETHGVLHKLAGSSGMYGYDDLSLRCREVMSNLNDLNVDDSVKALSQIIELLEQYR